MWPAKIFLAFIVSAVAVYQILPFLTVQASKSLRQIRPDYSSGHRRRSRQFLNRLIQELPMSRMAGYLKSAGDFRPDAVVRYMKRMFLLAGLPLLAAALTGRPVYQALLMTAVGISMMNGRISRRMKQRRDALERSFYKIYRFIDSQMTAGIKATDVIKGLHESIDDPLIKPTLIRFVARYSLTLNLDDALNEIRQSYTGKDIETLGTQLRQVIVTGSAGRSFQRTEELLFTRYFSLLQQQTASIRNRLLLAAVLMIIPTLLLFLMPMFHEALTALATVFG